MCQRKMAQHAHWMCLSLALSLSLPFTLSIALSSPVIHLRKLLTCAALVRRSIYLAGLCFAEDHCRDLQVPAQCSIVQWRLSLIVCRSHIRTETRRIAIRHGRSVDCFGSFLQCKRNRQQCTTAVYFWDLVQFGVQSACRAMLRFLAVRGAALGKHPRALVSLSQQSPSTRKH